MNSGSAMRNSKTRSVLYALAVCGMCLTAYLLSRTHSELKIVEKSHNRCIQQRDSLSAQLQVVYEHKNRLEKSLQEEKASYKNFRLDSQKSIVSLQNQLGTEKRLAQEKLDSLNKEHEELQEQFDDSDRKFNVMKDLVERLKQNLTQAEEARIQSQSEFNNQIQTIRQQKEEQISKLEEVIRELEKNERDLTHNNLSQALTLQQKAHKEGEKRKQVETPHHSSMDYFLKKNIFPVHSINSNRATNEYWLNVIPKPLLLRPRSQDLKINEKRWTSKYLPVPHWVRNNGKGMKKRESFQREVNTDSGRLIHENNLDHRWRVSLNQNNFIIQTPYSNNEQQNKAIHRLHSNVDIKNDVTQKLYNNAGSQNYVLSPKPHNNVEAQNVIQQRPHNNVEPQNDVPQRPHNNAEPQNDVPQRSYNNGLIQSKFVLQRPYNNGQSQKDVVIQEPYNNDQSQDEFIQKLYNSGGLKNSFVIQKPYNNNQPQNDMFQKQYDNSGPQKEKVKMSNIEKHHLESKDRDHDYDYNGDGNEGDDQDLGGVDDNNQLIDGNQDGLDHGKVFKDADFDDQLQNNEEDEVSRDQAGHD